MRRIQQVTIGLAAVTAVAGTVIAATLIRASAAEDLTTAAPTPPGVTTESGAALDTGMSATTVAPNWVTPSTTTTPPTTTTTTSASKKAATSTQPTKPKTTTAKPPPAVGAPCSAAARACIDLSANRSWLLDGAGNVVYGPVPITHGRPGWRTPAGTFRVQFKDIDHRSELFNDAPMPYSVFFNGGIAFHAGSLRVPSHGCIHLSTAAAKTYFNTLKVGDIVQVVP
jgi:lipoprotein-anchoring transpeptidase ErfK/SrfK